MFENYIRPQVEYYITVIRLFGIKTATVIVILLSLRSKMHRVRLTPLLFVTELQDSATVEYCHIIPFARYVAYRPSGGSVACS